MGIEARIPFTTLGIGWSWNGKLLCSVKKILNFHWNGLLWFNKPNKYDYKLSVVINKNENWEERKKYLGAMIFCCWYYLKLTVSRENI